MTFKNVKQVIAKNVEKTVQKTDFKNINIFKYFIRNKSVFEHLSVSII